MCLISYIIVFTVKSCVQCTRYCLVTDIRIQICARTILSFRPLDCTTLRLLVVTPTDGPAWVVGDIRRNECNRFGGHYNCPGDVLVSLSQKDRLFKVSLGFLLTAAF
jgi:hypothetical protein